MIQADPGSTQARARRMTEMEDELREAIYEISHDLDRNQWLLRELQEKFEEYVRARRPVEVKFVLADH